MRKILYMARLVVVGSLLAGCATTPPGSEAPVKTTPDRAPVSEPRGATDTGAAEATEPREDIVARRGNERWELLFVGEYGDAYEYLSPAYRTKLTRTEYIVKMAQQKVRWNTTEFEAVECEEELCMARWNVTWTYLIPVRGAGAYQGEKLMKESWIEVDGEWYFVPPT